MRKERKHYTADEKVAILRRLSTVLRRCILTMPLKSDMRSHGHEFGGDLRPAYTGIGSFNSGLRLAQDDAVTSFSWQRTQEWSNT